MSESQWLHQVPDGPIYHTNTFVPAVSGQKMTQIYPDAHSAVLVFFFKWVFWFSSGHGKLGELGVCCVSMLRACSRIGSMWYHLHLFYMDETSVGRVDGGQSRSSRESSRREVWRLPSDRRRRRQCGGV